MLTITASFIERLETRQSFWLQPAVLCHCQLWCVRACQPPAVAKLTHYSLIYLVRHGLILPRPAARHRQAPLINTNNPGKSLKSYATSLSCSASAGGEGLRRDTPKVSRRAELPVTGRKCIQIAKFSYLSDGVKVCGNRRKMFKVILNLSGAMLTWGSVNVWTEETPRERIGD